MILINLQKAFDTIGWYLAFKIQVLSSSAIKAKANSELFSLPRQDLAEVFAYHVSNGFGIPLHFAKDYDLVF